MSTVVHPTTRTVTTVVVIALSVVVVALAGAVGYLVIRAQDQDVDLAAFAHAAVQQNVQARYDDCQRGEQLRAALRAQVLASRRTNPILYKLVPSLDTPQVHRLVRAERRRQLQAYRSIDCRTYALAAVPLGHRGDYRVP